MRKPSFVALILTLSSAAFAADFAPALQWVATAGGSGNTSVAKAAADARGNLYIVGATTSLDFPTTAATQAGPGGSMLVRIDLATATAARLFPAKLPAITAAAAAPASPGTLYTASNNQIWKTADAGSTWTMVYQFPSGAAVFGLAVDPTSSNTVYAGTSTVGINKSTDGGITWAATNNGIPPNPNGTINVGGVWIEPSMPNLVFAATGFGLARSTDGGNTWTLVTGGGNPFSILAFDPSTAGTLYLLNSGTASKSTDNGLTFAPLAPLPDKAVPLTLATDPHHAGVLYVGASAGVYQSSDAGVTWILKAAGLTNLLVADPNSSAFYAVSSGYGIVKSTDGFATTSPIGPNQPSVRQLIVSGPNLFEISALTADAFAMKLDNNGNVVYSTYFGGSGDDAARALAVGSDGSLYVAGTTTSADLPVTPGAYLTRLPLGHGGAASFVLKLNPDGSLAWATYFTESNVSSIAVDSAGDPFIGGYTGGGLPTTPGAYQTTFQQSVTSNGFFSVIGPTAAYVTKFNPKGTALVYSTYVPTDNQKNVVEIAQALVVDSAGNAWIGAAVNPGIVPSGTAASVVELNPTGSAVLASAVQTGLDSVAALALDAGSNVYVAGYYNHSGPFPATPGAFQSAPQPAIPMLPYQAGPGGGSDAFVAKWDSSLTHLLAATLLGGELPDSAASVAIDASGAVIVAGTTGSKAFPTHAPFQELFSSSSGFVAGFDSNLSNLLFSTYLGDGRPFAAQTAVADGNGNILLAGSTLTPGASFLDGVGNIAVANKISLPPAPAVRLDSVQNYASHLAQPLAPGEPVIATGAGFGNGAQILVDGSPLATISATATSLVAVLPDTAVTSGIHTLQVSNNGTLSNSIYAPAASASPAIYSVDGSTVGQGYILNNDGTLNSPSNPAAPGSAITIFAAGAGQYTLNNGYAVTALLPAVFIDGFYCNGIAATIGPVNGLPGNVYQLGVYVPDPVALAQVNPDLKNFKFPAQSAIQLAMGSRDSISQTGILINIR